MTAVLTGCGCSAECGCAAPRRNSAGRRHHGLDAIAAPTYQRCSSDVASKQSGKLGVKPCGAHGASPRHSDRVYVRTTASVVTRCFVTPTARTCLWNSFRPSSSPRPIVFLWAQANNTWMHQEKSLKHILWVERTNIRTCAHTSWLKQGSRSNFWRNCHRFASKINCAGCLRFEMSTKVSILQIRLCNYSSSCTVLDPVP